MYYSTMTTLVGLADQQHTVRHGVSWSDYERTLNEIGNQPIHVAFLDGVMELVPPLPEHERPKKAIGNLIVVMATPVCAARTDLHPPRSAGSLAL